MRRKILGILNIVAGLSIIVLNMLLWARGNILVQLRAPESLIDPALFSLVTVTSFASGILVLKGQSPLMTILAAVNLIFAGFALFVLVVYVFFSLFD